MTPALPKHSVRGIPGFFAAIFSVVTPFDVCPVGWYNCRMEFLGRTTDDLARAQVRLVLGRDREEHLKDEAAAGKSAI